MNFETLQLDSPDIPELCREKYRALLGEWPAPGEMDDRAADWAMAWLTATQEQAQGDDGWIEWGGGECPVGPETEVEIQLRWDDVRESTNVIQAGRFPWIWSNDSYDIIAYRIVKEPRHG